MRALRAVGVWVLFAGACARSSPAGAGEAGPQSTPPAAKAMKAAPSAVASSASAPAVADAPPVGGAWAEALRMERWEEAATLIDALPEASRNAPGVRYARARVAARLGEHERAVELLSELETKLPVLASEIARHRAESELEAGPFTAAAAWFDAQPGVDAALDAATAHERAGERDPARRAVDRALQALARAKRPSLARGARARALRARLAEAAGDLKLAERDRRWIAVSAPTTPEAAEVAARVTLGPAERLVRARALAEAGRVADTDAEAEALGKLPKTPARAGELLHLRALARYRARVEPKEAAQLFSRAAQTNPSDPAGELFYAARSWSRAMQDERAIKEYENLARRFPKTAHAESARYLAARLHFILGHWKQAASGYAEYLERYRGKGRYARSAEYERAVAWLAGERATEAARAFASLVKTTRDRNLAPRYRELEGVALMGAGKQRDAATRFRQVIEESPLSFPALASAARLSALGEPAPPPIAPPPGAAARAPLEIALPPKVAVLSSLGLDGEAEDALIGFEPELRREHGERGEEAVCEAYGKLSLAARRYRAGQRAIGWADLESAPSAGTRWKWDCVYPRPYAPAVREAEKEWELPEHIVYAIMRQESAFSPDVVSPAQAVGLLQLMPATARQAASELEVPFEPLLLESPPYNIRLGSYYLGKVLKTFGGNAALAAAAYNAGPHAVSQWLASGEHLPLDVWVARIPFSETRGYVCRVVGNMARYAFLEGGAGAIPELSLELPRGLRAAPDAY